jgi:hypothetical protein
MTRAEPETTGAPSWSRIKELFGQAVEIDPAERAAWIDRVCNGDRKLQAEIVSLLEYDWTADPFLETPIRSSAEATSHASEYQAWAHAGFESRRSANPTSPARQDVPGVLRYPILAP